MRNPHYWPLLNPSNKACLKRECFNTSISHDASLFIHLLSGNKRTRDAVTDEGDQ